MPHYPCPDCCGGATCLIADDNFDRADEDIVAGWTELEGDWEIETNKLQLEDGD